MSNYPFQQFQQGQPAPAPMPILHNPFRPDRPAMPFHAAGEKDVAKQQSIYSGTNRDYLALKNKEQWNKGEIQRHQQQVQKQQNKKPKDPVPVPIHGKVKPDKPAEKVLTIVRESGGQVWDDQSLLEWDPAHFRLFVGDLAGEVTDDTLFPAFARYPTLVKARVIRDQKTDRSKGYGFVSFSSPDNFLKSWKEMNGKYIGSHPIKLRKATTELKPKVITQKSLAAKKRFSPYEVAKLDGEGKNWKELKRKERKHNKLIGLHRVGNGS
jgi:RNA recognition motif. (a.k.a. RRM, RBD, or RNP domain)